eukprot:scaffold11381_cov68-Phaeocystis_antarctica.AAC.5
MKPLFWPRRDVERVSVKYNHVIIVVVLTALKDEVVVGDCFDTHRPHKWSTGGAAQLCLAVRIDVGPTRAVGNVVLVRVNRVDELPLAPRLLCGSGLPMRRGRVGELLATLGFEGVHGTGAARVGEHDARLAEPPEETRNTFQKSASTNLRRGRAVHPNWVRFPTVDVLQEGIVEMHEVRTRLQEADVERMALFLVWEKRHRVPQPAQVRYHRDEVVVL